MPTVKEFCSSIRAEREKAFQWFLNKIDELEKRIAQLEKQSLIDGFDHLFEEKNAGLDNEIR